MPENNPAVASSDRTAPCFIRRLEKQWNKLTLGASSVLEITFLWGMITTLEKKCYSGNWYSEYEQNVIFVL